MYKYNMNKMNLKSKLKDMFNLKVRMLLTHGVLFFCIILFFSCSVLDEFVLIPTEATVCATILFLTIEYIFDNYVINKKLNINNDEFLKYKCCNVLNDCDCNMARLIGNVFDMTTEIVVCKDVKMRYTMCSNVFLKFIGLPSKSVIGKTPNELFDKKDADMISGYDSLAMTQRTPITYNMKFSREGREQIYERISSPIISNGTVVGVLTLTRNVTDSANLRKSLEFSNSRLCLLLNHLPIMAFILDTQGNFVFGNENAKNFFLKGIDATVEGLNIKYDVNDLKKLIVTTHNDALWRNESSHFEKICVAANGDKYTYDVSVVLLRDENEVPEYVISFAKNIESEKRINDQRETYIATLSHDLKTPTLAQIRSLELLLSGQFGDFNEAQSEMLALTLDSCKYMYEMLYTLLASYKFENGEVVLNYTNFDLMPVVHSSLEALSKKIHEKSLKIDITPSVADLKISGDKTELSRVVSIFIKNGITYAPVGSKVEISMRKKHHSFEFKVKNSSKYIHPERMELLFSKYSTSEQKFDKVGVEIGMYLTKKIIEAHGGRVIAESSIMNSNTFGFNIPIENFSQNYSVKVPVTN